MNTTNKLISMIGLIVTTMITYETRAQEPIVWSELPPLPDTAGRAGMFAGVSQGRLFCMGGANFPDGYPWEGGRKKWHNDIFMLEAGANQWRQLADVLPGGLAYGVSVSYKDCIFLVGGSTATVHSDETWLLRWGNGILDIEAGPRLPHPLANMAGTRVGSLLMVVGGMEKPDGAPLLCCYGLDLDAPDNGWFALPEWPGEGRIFPVTGSFAGKFYLFSGENKKRNAVGLDQRHIFQDAFCFAPAKTGNRWSGEWHRLSDLPVGMSAGANPAPLVAGRAFLFWGGVDRLTALHSVPQAHPGIGGELLWYNPETDRWGYDEGSEREPGRVTLPTVDWNGQTYYISGEVKPGIRTNRITGVTVEKQQQKP